MSFPVFLSSLKSLYLHIYFLLCIVQLQVSVSNNIVVSESSGGGLLLLGDFLFDFGSLVRWEVVVFLVVHIGENIIVGITLTTFLILDF